MQPTYTSIQRQFSINFALLRFDVAAKIPQTSKYNKCTAGD